jgi:hypothetical protein
LILTVVPLGIDLNLAGGVVKLYPKPAGYPKVKRPVLLMRQQD